MTIPQLVSFYFLNQWVLILNYSIIITILFKKDGNIDGNMSVRLANEYVQEIQIK